MSSAGHIRGEAILPDLDEYIRTEVRRLAGDVDGSGVFARLEERMSRRRRLRAVQRTALVLVVLAATGLVVFGLYRVFERPNTPATGLTRATVASIAVGGDLRVILVAQRGSASDEEASVVVQTSIRRGGEWVSDGRHAVGRPRSWRWDVVTAPGGVCRLLASDAPAPRFAVSVRAGGDAACSTPYTFTVEGGRVLSA